MTPNRYAYDSAMEGNMGIHPRDHFPLTKNLHMIL